MGKVIIFVSVLFALMYYVPMPHTTHKDGKISAMHNMPQGGNQ